MTYEDEPHDETREVSAADSLIGEISSISAEAYLRTHTEPGVTVTDTRDLMRKNTKLGRMALETAGQLAKRGISSEDAYFLGLIHGLGLAERKRQEEIFEAQLQLPVTPLEPFNKLSSEPEADPKLPPTA